MDRDLERIMEHEKQLSARIREAEDKAAREVELRCREAAESVESRRKAAVTEWENRRRDSMSAEKSRQESMKRDLDDAIARLEGDRDLCDDVERFILENLFPAGGMS